MQSLATVMILATLVAAPAPRQRAFDQLRAIHANVDKTVEYVRPAGTSPPLATAYDVGLARWSVETREPATQIYGSLGQAVELWRASEFRGLALRDWLKIPADQMESAIESATALFGSPGAAVQEFLHNRRDRKSVV